MNALRQDGKNFFSCETPDAACPSLGEPSSLSAACNAAGAAPQFGGTFQLQWDGKLAAATPDAACLRPFHDQCDRLLMQKMKPLADRPGPDLAKAFSACSILSDGDASQGFTGVIYDVA